MAFKRMNKRNFFSNIVSIIILFLFCMMLDQSDSNTYSNLISKVLIFSIAALSLNIVCGCLGEFALGHGGFLLIGYTVSCIVGEFIYANFSGSYTSLVYHPRDGLKALGYLILSSDVIAAAIVTGIFGFIVGLIALGRLKGDYLAIVTLGVSLIFVNVCKNVPTLGGGEGIDITDRVGGSTLIYAIILVISIFLIITFMKSRFGRGILAIRDDNIAAEASGIPVNKYKVMAFTFSAFFAGLAGGLYSHFNAFKPIIFGQDLSIELLIIVVLGGLGSLTGSVIASFIIVFYNVWFCTQTWVPDFIKNNPKIIYGIILVLIMLFRSSGILGNSEFTWDWFYKKLKLVWSKIVKIFKKKTPKEVE